jgi:hypothetical protein
MSDSNSGRGLPLLVFTTMCVAMATAPSKLSLVAHAQAPAVSFDIRAAKGLVVSPIYEGWYEVGGATHVLFGYYNRNLEEVVDIPIGPGNKMEPGPADQAQPTRFFPGRHYGVFAAAVPKDKPKTEVTWTLTANGQTLSIPAFLDALYFVSPHKEDGGAYPGNTPPIVQFEQSGPSAQGPLGITVSRSATVSRPLTVDVWVTDDGLPPTRRAAVSPTAPVRPQGLSVSWSVYRGPGSVSFSIPAPPLEQGKVHTTATFGEAGNYVLRVLAVDSRSGTMCCWTNGYVRVAVEAQKIDDK